MNWTIFNLYNTKKSITIVKKPIINKIKICIVGTHQSGSTRLFNLVRLIYEKKNKTVYSGWNIEDVDILHTNADVILCKVHESSYSYLNNFHIILLPLRNIMDAAISENTRFQEISLLDSCLSNIRLFNQFKSKASFIFRYEDYSVYYIKKLSSVLGVQLTYMEIIEIMKELENMINDKNLIEDDDHSDENYQKTLLCKNHNTSGGKNNKFVGLCKKDLMCLLKNDEIIKFLKEHKYI